MDKRLIKTQEKLYNSLNELFTSKTYDEISISDICEKANIKRPTFYNHFENKEDFVRKTCYNNFKNIIQKSKISDKASFKTYFLTLVEGYLKELTKYREKIIEMNGKNDPKPLTSIIYDSLYKIFTEKIKSLYPYELNDSLIDTFVVTHIGVFLAIITRYLLDPSKDLDELMKDLKKVFNIPTIEKEFKK